MHSRRTLAWRTCAAALVLLLSSVVLAQDAPPATQTSDKDAAVQNQGDEEVPLVFWNRQITVFRSYLEHVSPAARARIASLRLETLPQVSPKWHVVAMETSIGPYTGAMITANEQYIFAILTTDLDAESKETLKAATDKAVTQLQAALEARTQQFRPSVILRGIALSIVATLVLLLSLWLLIRARRLVLARFEERARASTQLRLGGYDLRPLLRRAISSLTRFVAWFAAITFGYLWLAYVLLRFPYSQPWGQELGTLLFRFLEKLGSELLDSVPGILTVALIFLVTRALTRAVSGFFGEVEKGNITVPWPHRDTASASRHLVIGTIWLFALTVAYPHIPGSSTDAFKGVSVLVGLMLSLGSAGFVNQVMCGLVVIYSRALKLGEFVRIGDDFGTVSEIGMLSTKIITHKREEVTIPSGVLVGTRIMNYSRQAPGVGAVLGTTVTIGYDAAWRQVHAMLLQAAAETEGVRQDPAPRVLQRALSDFFVEYELIFNVDDPVKRFQILSELHKHIQDAFNEEGVQIMSPHYETQPNEKVFVPKSRWFPKPREVKPREDRR